MESKPSKKSKPKPKPKKKAKKKKSKKPYYVNPVEFFDRIKLYYETDDLTEDLGEAVYKIAIGLSYAPNFINYSYKDEMIGDAILKMMMALENKKFNCDSGHSPFSYFTTIAFHAFINRIKKEKKHRETIIQYQEKIYNDLAGTTEFSEHLDQSDPKDSDSGLQEDQY